MSALFGEIEISDDFITKQIIAAERAVGSCENIGQSTLRCEITHVSQITEALGQEPRITLATFHIAAESLNQSGVDFPFDSSLYCFCPRSDARPRTGCST